MKYNSSEIMKKTWSMFRMAQMFKKPETFADFLKLAWSDAKRMAALASEKPVTRRPATTDELEAAMFDLNMKDSWSAQDYAEYDEMGRKLAAIRQQSKTARAAA